MDKQKFPEEIAFWNREANKIQLINRDDFHLEKLFTVLGIENSPLTKSFGITDRAEILRRAKILKCLLKHKDLRKYLQSMDLSTAEIPGGNTTFLKYFFDRDFKSHNSYFEMLNDFEIFMKDRSGVPEELESFVRYINTTSAEQKKFETELSRELYNELNQGIFIEGTISIHWKGWQRFFLNYTKALGYKRYAYIDDFRETGKTPWWRNGLLDKFPLKYLTKAIEKKIQGMKKDATALKYSSRIITEVPQSIIDVLESELKQNNRDNPNEHNVETVDIEYYFKYSDKGLEIKLLGFDNIKFYNLSKCRYNFLETNFPGYSVKKIAEIKKRNESFDKAVKDIEKRNILGNLLNYFRWGYGEGIKLIKLESPHVDNEYKWSILSDLKQLPQYSERFCEAEAYRDYIKSRFETLKEIAFIAEALERMEKRTQLRFRFPTILPDANHVVAFKNLVPVQILEEVELEDLVLITSVPPINGTMIGFTGNNAGGKSVAQESIINAIYLAQSGLPIFGKNFVVNVKNTLGMVFLERGNGSTAQLLLLKSKNILKALEENKHNNIFLVLDEVGTGTSEMDGLYYGKRLLQTISEYNTSVIFSTQITELAEFAQTSLGAHIIQFDGKHIIKPGIGTGNLENLIKETGLEQYLKPKQA